MKRIAIVVVLAGCGASSAPPAHPEPETGSGSGSAAPVHSFHEQVLAQMTSFTQRMCECADKSCAQGVLDEFKLWGDAMEKNPDADKPPPPDLAPAFNDLGTRFGECTMRNLGAEDPNAANGPPASFQDSVLVDMTALADRMCACTELACAKGVEDEFNAFNARIALDPAAKQKPTDEQAEKLTAQSSRFYDCSTKIKKPKK
ncbi:MAG TPA: hypothetical protein VGM90_31510 [Kofleriaceae bacterium]|jgi:hypothetical protein